MLEVIFNYLIDYKIQIIKSIMNMIPWFASKQIRNVAVSIINNLIIFIHMCIN